MKNTALLKTSVCVMALVFLAGAVAHGGTVTGTIKYEGEVPSLKAYDMAGVPACHAMHTKPIANEMLVLGKGQTMANIVVRVKSGLPKKAYPVSSKPVVLDQRGCVYSPHVVAIQVGQELKILNSDNTMHNVHSLSKVNKGFNLPMLAAKPGQPKKMTKTFSKVEDPFPIKCDVHPWMRAYCYIVEHPFFDVTGKDGKFTIEGLDAGTYEIEAWHERLKTKSGTVTITKDGTATINFSFSIPKKK